MPKSKNPWKTVSQTEENTMNDAELIEKAVEAAQQAPQVPQRAVPFGPVPMSWNISQGNNNEGQPIVVIHVATPEGDKVFFLQPSIAKKIGEALVKQGSASESGLIIPQ